MERLTKRLDDGQAVMDCKSCELCAKNCVALACRNRLKDRLAAYEDTGLEPEEVVALKDAEQKRREGCQRCWNGECMMSGVDYSCETTCDKCRYNLRDKHFCPDCGRDLRGESQND